MAIKAFINRVLVKEEKKEDDGIIIPSGNAPSAKHIKGKVHSVGERIDKELNSIPLKEGDVIYFNPFGNTVIEFEEENY